MKARATGLVIGLAWGLTAVPAVASPVTYTIWGTVIDGHDASGQFGGGSLAGDAFLAVETFDPAQAQSSWRSGTASGANGDATRTGRHFASVVLTIGGFTRRFADSTSNIDSAAGERFGSNVQNGADNLGFNVVSNRILGDYTAENGVLEMVGRYAGYYTLTEASGQQAVWSTFTVNGFDVAATVSAVPLPAAAPLFGAGLMMLAAMGVRHRRAAVAVAAQTGSADPA